MDTKPNAKIGYFDSCNLTQKLSPDFIQWSLKMHLQDKHDKNQVLRLFAYNQIVHQLVELFDKPPDLKSCSEEEHTELLLMKIDELSVTYDTT